MILSAGEEKRRAWMNISIIIGLLAITSLPYGCVGSFEFVALDDQQYVVQSELVRNGLDPLSMWGALTEFHADNWHPLVWWSLMLDAQLFGLHPGPFHLENVAWHLANVVWLYLAMLALTDDHWRSATVAAIFGVHPLHVESVAWVTERKDVLSGFFFMLGLWAYAYWTKTRRPAWWWLVTGCMIGGLMSKQIVITLPCVFLLLDVWPLGRLRLGSNWSSFFRQTGALLYEKLAWFGLSAGAVLIVLQAQTQAREFGEDWPLTLRLSNAVLSVMRYLGKIIWPTQLSVAYPYNPPESITPIYAAAVTILVLSCLAVMTSRRWPVLLVGWLWFLGTLAPVSGLIQAGKQSMADRYMYLPLIGLSLAVVWMIPVPRSRTGKWGWSIAVAAGLLALSLRTAQQVQVWRNTDTLFRHALAVDPTNDSAHFVLAAADLQAGRLAEGITHLRSAVEWELRRWEARRGFGGSPSPRRQMEVNRGCADVWLQIAQLHVKLHQSMDAITALHEAVRLDPDLLEARFLLGKLLLETEEFDAARTEFESVLSRHPGHTGARGELSRIPGAR